MTPQNNFLTSAVPVDHGVWFFYPGRL